jgi:hypothetical protein
MHVDDLHEHDGGQAGGRGLPISRAIGGESLSPLPSGSEKDEEERGHGRNGLGRAKKQVGPHEKTWGQQTILASPR